MRIFDELNMKKFNPQIIFFHFNLICICFLCFSCRHSIDFTVLSGKKIKLQDSTAVFIFLNAECPICRKYQGEFYRLKAQNPQTNIYYVFCGDQKLEDLNVFCDYDSIPASRIVLDKQYELARKLNATVTPQAVIMKGNKTRYLGKIDDRFEKLGSSKPRASINYVNNALFSLSENEAVQIPFTQAVGCFIEPK